MSSSDTPSSTRGTASGSANAAQQDCMRIAASPHALAADLFAVAAPHLSSEELEALDARREDVRVQLDGLVSLATLLGVAGTTLGDAPLQEAIFVLSNGIEAASASLSIANDAAALLKRRQGGAA